MKKCSDKTELPFIRARQEEEQAEFRRRFKQMAGEGSNEPEPKTVLQMVRRVKKGRRTQAVR